MKKPIYFKNKALLEQLSACAKEKKMSLSSLVEEMLNNKFMLMENPEYDDYSYYQNNILKIIVDSCHYYPIRWVLKNNIKLNAPRNVIQPPNKYVLSKLYDELLRLNDICNASITVVCAGQVKRNDSLVHEDDFKQFFLNLISDDKQLFNRLSELTDYNQIRKQVFQEISNQNSEHDNVLVYKMMSATSAKKIHLDCMYAVFSFNFQNLSKYENKIEYMDFDSISYFPNNTPPRANTKYRFWIPLRFIGQQFQLVQGNYYIGILRRERKTIADYKSNCEDLLEKIRNEYCAPIHTQNQSAGLDETTNNKQAQSITKAKMNAKVIFKNFGGCNEILNLLNSNDVYQFTQRAIVKKGDE